ncbi:MAG: hypothetical protein IKO15_08520 [Clostridiales bacterium]|nr:hypothetical protein [Clostridiales bacterium]
MLDSQFNVKKTISDQLARSLGISDYLYLINSVKQTNVSHCLEYQTIFNRFYGVRRNRKWRDKYYEYFQSAKTNSNLQFIDILKSVSQIEHAKTKFEPSFSSKMYATLYPEKPIWDYHVLNNLGLLNAWERNKTFNNAEDIYNEIIERYDKLVKKGLVEEWDRLFANNKEFINISDSKKIDYILWCKR